MNVLATFQNDPWKFTDVRALTVIFHVRSWKLRKKIPKKFFGRLWKKNPELILINMFSPTFVPNLVTLAWKMSSGMPKEAGLLNGPLCTYLMRQNLHDQTRPRSLGNKCPCHVAWLVPVLQPKLAITAPVNVLVHYHVCCTIYIFFCFSGIFVSMT